MKQFKIFVFIAFAAIFLSCGNQSSADANNTDTPITTENELKIDICGTYEGVIPAPNSAGISMHLTINSDETFTLKREYKGNKEGSFNDQGKYTIINDNVIELTDKKGIKTYYRIDNKNLILSDPEGNVADAEYATRYQLTKI